jgi:hypothetical protein
MTKEKDYFDNITPKLVLGQLYKSVNTMKLVQLKTNSRSVYDICKNYYTEITDLVDSLAQVHFGLNRKKDLDDIPSSKYIDPIMHMNDIIYYLEANSKLFKSHQEQLIINKLLGKMSDVKYMLTLE